MYIFIIGLIIFFAFLLVLVILAQNSKGGGLTSQFGGSAASNIIGVKKTGDLLEKLTWGFAIALVVLTLGTQLIRSSATEGGATRSIIEERALQSPLPAAPSALPNADTTAAIPDAGDIPAMIDTAND